MITLAQIKQYLGLTESTYDSFLNDVILMSKSHIEDYLNWENLADTQYIKKYDYQYTQKILDNTIHLGMRAVSSVSAWVYYDSDRNETELFTGDNTVANSTDIIGDCSIKVYKGVYLGEKVHKITFNAGYVFSNLTGTVTTAIGDATVTGVGTAFTTELSVDDYIIVGNEKKQVLSITDNTHLETVDTFYSVNSGVAITKTTLPDGIRRAFLECGAVIFKNSYQSDGTLRESGRTINQGGQSVTINLKNLDLSYIDTFKNYQ